MMFLIANIVSYAIMPPIERKPYITFQEDDTYLQENLMKPLRLAQKMLFRICAKLVGSLNKYFHSAEFVQRHRLA
ncbi:hypothetical protein TRIP_B30022 [uncultured Desulfatiglans sp.]|nr:hypothetical protein TRIP_B30022 [uncultured Desulfatiglans sp.]